jgi:Glycosyl transferase family 2
MISQCSVDTWKLTQEDDVSGVSGGRGDMQVLIVVVCYKMSFGASETISTLSRAFKAFPHLLDSISVLVWDNSPSSGYDSSPSFPFEYKHSSENVGVSGAYNSASKIAEASGCPWLLLLDQDTTLSGNFLSRMLEYSRELESNPGVAAVAPFLMDGNKPISPGVIPFNHVKPLPMPLSGEYAKEAFASNSGTLMRVASLKEIGGYNEDFWLDYSDIVAFHLLYRHGKRLFIAGDLQLQHKLTSNDYDGSMSPERYQNGVLAEGAYWDIYRSSCENIGLTARLAARSLKQYCYYSSKAYSKITMKFLYFRLFTSRAARLQIWNQKCLSRRMSAISRATIVKG